MDRLIFFLPKYLPYRKEKKQRQNDKDSNTVMVKKRQAMNIVRMEDDGLIY